MSAYFPAPGGGHGFRAGAGADSVLGGDLNLAASSVGVRGLALGDGASVAAGTTGVDGSGLAVGRDAASGGDGGVAIGAAGDLDNPTVTAGLSPVAIGVGAEATFDYAVALGQYVLAHAVGSTAVNCWQVTADYGTALGWNAACTVGTEGTAVGASARTSAQDGTALGRSTTASALRATAVGALATASAQDATAVGSSSDATVASATAVGTGAQAIHDHAVALGASATTVAADGAVIRANQLEVVPSAGVPTPDTTIVLRSPNGARWRISVSNLGAVTAAAA